MRKLFLALLFPLASAPTFAASAASFELLDQNDDRMISRNEWHDFPQSPVAFRSWDANADSYIDENEFNDLDWDYDFSLWDRNRDAHLENNEIYEGLFDALDANGDGHWDKAEWDDASDEGWFDA